RRRVAAFVGVGILAGRPEQMSVRVDGAGRHGKTGRARIGIRRRTGNLARPHDCSCAKQYAPPLARRSEREASEARETGYFGLTRPAAGWPCTLKRLPVSVTLLPSTWRIEKSSVI